MLLYSPYALGTLPLANRMVMSPMTRSRATGGQPNELMRLYYRQRAGAGLLIAEGTQTSPFAKGFPAVPGIYTEAQIAGWRLITDDVHAAGGRIFLQLWHCGRISHPLNQPDGRVPIAPFR
jgi:N-ethylmaleimide reductase